MMLRNLQILIKPEFNDCSISNGKFKKQKHSKFVLKVFCIEQERPIGYPMLIHVGGFAMVSVGSHAFLKKTII